MSSLSPTIVLVKQIHSEQSREMYDSSLLEETALLILSLEGAINPPILLREGLRSYKVIEGDFTYFAALRAKEIDPLKGESISAYVVDSEEKLIPLKKQIDIFRRPTQSSISTQVTSATHSDDRIIEKHFTRLETTMKSDNQQVQQRLDNLETTLAQLFTAVNNISAEIKTLRGTTSSQPKPVIHKKVTPVISTPIYNEEAWLKAINTMEERDLRLKLQRAKIRRNVIDNIITLRKQPFIDEIDVEKRVAGLGKKTLDKIISLWE